MTTDLPSALDQPLAPVPRTERIAALDVVRGFALIGILLMNIEFFNRATLQADSGMQQGLTGANHWFSWIVQYFVVGKFWTIFSLLFGMGFAVMLMRAEQAQRNFMVPYLRRIAALAVFGALHFILLWSGDILFSYAVGALALLIVLFGRARALLAGIAALVVLGLAASLKWPFVIAACVAFYGVCGWYLRCPERITLRGRSVPIFKMVTRSMMTAAVIALLAGLLIPALPHEARLAMPIVGAAVLVLAILMERCHHPVQARPWRMGVGLYVFFFALMTALGAAQYYYPDPAQAAAKAAPASQPARPPSAEDKAAAESRKQRAADLAREQADIAQELRVLTKGSYADVVALRAAKFGQHVPEQFGFAPLLIAMFLLGLWFVRSGVMSDTRAHLPLFRKLALYALPVGVGLGLIGSQIATHGIPGQSNGFEFALGLLLLGNLPACLGYVAVIVLMLNSNSVFSRVSVLAPFGRMALTNYLTHSLVFSFIFYGYGLGYFGIERIWQLACVCAMVLVQVPLSHLWLSHFRYGPMEWLWRAITYWQIPAMRITRAERAGAVQQASR